MSKPTDLQHDLERSLPAIASISSSFSQSQGFSPYFLSPEKRKAISDVRRTFCLFVTFDLLFISLLWIIELNVSREEANPGESLPFLNSVPSVNCPVPALPGQSFVCCSQPLAKELLVL